MTTEEKCSLLYQRMAAEQEQLREWLLTQPPGVILDHACAYAIREDITETNHMSNVRDVIDAHASAVELAEKKDERNHGAR